MSPTRQLRAFSMPPQLVQVHHHQVANGHPSLKKNNSEKKEEWENRNAPKCTSAYEADVAVLNYLATK